MGCRFRAIVEGKLRRVGICVPPNQHWPTTDLGGSPIAARWTAVIAMDWGAQPSIRKNHRGVTPEPGGWLDV